MHRPFVRDWLAPLAAYASIALIWVADTLRSPTTILHGHYDAYNYAWRIWWVAGGHKAWNAPLLSSPAVFYPLGHQLPSAEMTPLQLVPAALLSKVLGVVLAYNIVVYANFVFAGIAMYAFCRAMLVSRRGAFLGGLVYAFAAYPTSHALGHLPLIGTWTLPFGLMWIEKLAHAEDRRARLFYGSMVGVSVGLATWSAWYYTVIFGLALVVYGVLRLSRTQLPSLVLPAASAVAVAAVMVLPLYVLVRVSGSAESMKWPLYAFKGASPFAFLAPSAVQTLLGSLTNRWQPRSLENALHVGWVPLLLALTALAGRKAWSGRIARGPQAADAESGRADQRVPLLITGAIFLVISLGPLLYLHGPETWHLSGDVNIDVSVFGRNVIGFLRDHGLPLPAAVLMFTPVFESMREFTRYGVVVLMSVAAIAAIGFDVVSLRLTSRWRTILTALLVLLIVAEFFPQPISSPAAPTATDRWIADRPGGGSVVYLPMTQRHSDEQMLHTAWTGKPLAMGDATFLPADYVTETRKMEQYPDEAALDVMQKRDIRWIIWNSDDGGEAPEVPGVFKEAANFDGEVVLERVGPPLNTPVGTPDLD